MWSGPRNISTAMMRSFENRPDCVVVDEPFYAAYLAATGLQHPMRDEVLASQPTRAEAVVDALLAPLPAGRTLQYQKQMAHHMLEDFDLAWLASTLPVFLIRDPGRVLASYYRKRNQATLADIGVLRQAELFDREAQRLGAAPVVIDTDDVLADPPRMITRLCAALGISFLPQMLHWPPGRRATDGVWAPAWYAAVEQSTGFHTDATPPAAPLDGALAAVFEAAYPYYVRLRQHRILPK
jgi:hypothetical protein